MKFLGMSILSALALLGMASVAVADSPVVKTCAGKWGYENGMRSQLVIHADETIEYLWSMRGDPMTSAGTFTSRGKINQRVDFTTKYGTTIDVAATQDGYAGHVWGNAVGNWPLSLVCDGVHTDK